MSCINKVGNANWPYCSDTSVKYGKVARGQRYRCKTCKRVFMDAYINQACYQTINKSVIEHLKEGCGIRSIARLLRISTNTVLSRITIIAHSIKKPVIVTESIYEVDELRTYVKSKSRECWVIYALDRLSGQVMDIKVGKRTKENIKRVIDTLLLAKCQKVYTDRPGICRLIIPEAVPFYARHGFNHIERKNLSLRTHLKRLCRKTICYSKSEQMLEACIRIYFWA